MTDGNALLKTVEYRILLEKMLTLPLPWEKLYGSCILVTGAAGLIGSFLVDVLMKLNEAKNAKITVIALGRTLQKLEKRFCVYEKNELLNLVFHDICAFDLQKKLNTKADFIFHLASNTHPLDYATKPIDTLFTNVIGTKNLLDYASYSGTKRFVYASSVEIYGENRVDLASCVEHFDESYCGYIDCNTIRACYSEGKRAGESLCQGYRAERGIDIVIPRLCRVYGETMLFTDSKALSQFIKNGLLKNDIVLKSQGNQKYSYLYVFDAVSALLHLLFFGKTGEAYNVASKESDVTLKDLAELVASLCGTKVVYENPSEAEQKGYSTATKALLNPAKLMALGWNARFDIKTGLTRTLNVLGGF